MLSLVAHAVRRGTQSITSAKDVFASFALILVIIMSDKELPASCSSPPNAAIVNYESSDDEESPQKIVNSYFFDELCSEDNIETEDFDMPSTGSLTADNYDDQNQTQLKESALSNPKLPAISQFLESQDQCRAREEVMDDDDLDSTPPAKRKRGNKYAVELSRLPSSMISFVKEVGEFFTKPMNLARRSPAMKKSTFDKTEERIRCK